MDLLLAILIPAGLAAVAVLSIRLATGRGFRPGGTPRDRPARTAAPGSRTAATQHMGGRRPIRIAAERWAGRLRAELYRLPPETSAGAGATEGGPPAGPPGHVFDAVEAVSTCAACGLEQPIGWVRCLRCGSVRRTVRIDGQQTDEMG